MLKKQQSICCFKVLQHEEHYHKHLLEGSLSTEPANTFLLALITLHTNSLVISGFGFFWIKFLDKVSASQNLL